MRFVLPLALFALAGCASATAPSAAASASAVEGNDPQAATFDWPVPEGWSKDSIPFPLSYAPELPYQSGVEEIRFAPKFFDPTADTYWAYNFAWILDDVAAPSAAELTDQLKIYYAGLAHAVDPDRFDAAAHHAEVSSSLATPNQYRGVLFTTDAFGDGRALRLDLVGETFTCGAHRVVIASLSPRLSDTAISGMLAAQKATFTCATARGSSRAR